MILSPTLTKVIGLLPKSLLKRVATKILNDKLRKYANLNISGLEEIKGMEAPIIFICNHLSNADGLIFNSVLKDFDPTFVAGVKLKGEAVTNLGMIIVKTTTVTPNSPDKEGLSKIVKILKGGNNIFIFPEGTRSRTGAMIKAKRGLYLIAKMSKAKIIPIGTWGTEKLLPIGESGSMSDETFCKADVYIKVGKPFYFSEKLKDEDKRIYEERVVDEAMKKIAELIPEEYRGEYR